jgi:aldehyde:ferredoxin oxidoreductase
MDEAVLPSFEHTELYPSPFLEKRHRLERKHFDPIMDEFYELHRWDRESVWPTRELLRRLDLEDVYEPMVSGAARVRAPV